jgi:trimeric autotransporter adhesin
LDIVSRGDVLVAVGNEGLILTSSDGVRWTQAASGTNRFLSAVTLVGSTFVVVGEAGTVLTSLDAVTWTAQTSNDLRTLRAATSHNATIIAAGQSGSSSDAAILISTDSGQTWSPQVSGSRRDFFGIAAGGGKLVTVGSDATVLVREW